MRNEERFNRFKDATWFPKVAAPVLIGGAGGIGSWLSLLLTRVGFSPMVFDFDTVEAHNIGGQLYGSKQVGNAKVEALKANIHLLSDEYIQVFNEMMDEDTMTHRYCFSAFDNMAARKAMFENWEKNYSTDPDAIFIDGRLTIEQLTIFCIQGGDIANIADYKKHHLFSDDLIPDAPCTLKQSSHTAAMIASFMSSFFTNFYHNNKVGRSERFVPAYWEYFTPIGMLDISSDIPVTIEEENDNTDSNESQGS